MSSREPRDHPAQAEAESDSPTSPGGAEESARDTEPSRRQLLSGIGVGIAAAALLGNATGVEAQHTSPFTEKDLDLLIRTVDLCPELALAIYATKLCRDSLRFPITSPDDLGALVKREGGTIRYKDRHFNFQHVQKFFPKFLFPIASVDALLGAALIATTAAIRHHRKLDEIARRKRFPTGLPAYVPADVSTLIFENE